MTDDEYVLNLTDARAAELRVAGGKGASLARLLAAGLPVPEGFVLATDAYQRFVHENDLDPRLLSALSAANASDPPTLQAASTVIGAHRDR
jgi:pyruvate,water dikinase